MYSSFLEEGIVFDQSVSGKAIVNSDCEGQICCPSLDRESSQKREDSLPKIRERDEANCYLRTGRWADFPSYGRIFVTAVTRPATCAFMDSRMRKGRCVTCASLGSGKLLLK